MKETEERAVLLEEEKQNINDHASELKETIKVSRQDNIALRFTNSCDDHVLKWVLLE